MSIITAYTVEFATIVAGSLACITAGLGSKLHAQRKLLSNKQEQIDSLKAAIKRKNNSLDHFANDIFNLNEDLRRQRENHKEHYNELLRENSRLRTCVRESTEAQRPIVHVGLEGVVVKVSSGVSEVYSVGKLVTKLTVYEFQQTNTIMVETTNEKGKVESHHYQNVAYSLRLKD